MKDTWPRTAKIYCHRADVWPDDLEIVERIPVRSCVRRGASIDLVLDRGREFRSQFVFTVARGREMIFWQSARTTKQARPAVALPTARAEGRVLEMLVDTHEQYPWTFTHQQATTTRRALPAGDYAVTVDGRIVAAVERKSLADLVATLTSGKLKFLLADLSTVPRAALVVEDRWSQVFKLDRVRPAVVAAGIAECQVRYPMVPILFCETRPWRRNGCTGSSVPPSSTTSRTQARQCWNRIFRPPQRLRRPNLRLPWCGHGQRRRVCLCRIGDVCDRRFGPPTTAAIEGARHFREVVPSCS